MSDGPAITFFQRSKTLIISDGSRGRFELPLSRAKRVVEDLQALIRSLEASTTPSSVSEEEAVGYQPPPDENSIAHHRV